MESVHFMTAKFYLKERLLCKTDKYLFCYHKGCVVLRKSKDKSIINKLRIQSIMKSTRAAERVLRYEPRAAFQIDDENFAFALHGAVYNYSVKKNIITAEHYFAKGMNNPLKFCVRYDENGNIVEALYGEYIWNTENGSVSIYRYRNKIWSEVFVFPSNSIKHIHNIVYDQYKDRYLILTGDSDSESGIWKADTDFKNVELIISGKQIYRACVAYPTKNGIYYATDTPLEQNKLYKLYENNDGSVSLDKIYDMPGPCIYGIILDDNLFMSTSVEGDPSVGKFRYRLSYRLGKGVKDRNVHIIKCSVEGNVSEIASFKKDILPMWLFQFGNALFPVQTDKSALYLCPQSVKGKKGTYVIYND